MTLPPLPYARQTIDDEDIAAVCQVLRGDWLTQGPTVKAFEQALCQLTGAKYCIAVANGTAALYLAVKSLGLEAGDIGLTSALSFAASANCLGLSGLQPDFIDIDPETYNISPTGLDQYCRRNPKVKVVIPVDFAGLPADLPAIEQVCITYGIKIIEDAAHAIGSTYVHGGKQFACGSCTHTDLAIFSFHPVKTITTGEGGAVLTNNPELAEKISKLANHGIERNPDNFIFPPAGQHWPYEVQDLSFNFRLTDLQAALGLSQLKRLAAFKKRRQELVDLYNEQLARASSDGLVILPSRSTNAAPCYHLYPIQLTTTAPVCRNELYQALRDRGIFTQIHYWPIHLQPYYQKNYGFRPGTLPITETFAANCLSLPLFPAMTEADVRRVCEVIYAVIYG